MSKATASASVAIIMGSETDLQVMRLAEMTLKDLDVKSHLEIVSAHRTPEKMVKFAKEAKDNGFKVIIAGAGGAAHLPGMVASLTTLPVIGVPVKVGSLDGLDALLSIAQMPKGIPVATVAVDNSVNAGLLAARILALSDKKLAKKLLKLQDTYKTKVKEMNLRVKNSRPKSGRSK
jgi:phosphoribosylaminoimidazole carboxylase PurE protein